MKFEVMPIRAAAVLGAAILSLTSAVALAQSADGPTQRVILKFKDAPLTQAAAATTALRGRVLSDTQARHGVGLANLRRLATGGDLLALNRKLSEQELNALVADFASDPNVEYAEVDRLMHPTLTPTDTRFNEQWHYIEAAGGINVQPAWDITNGSGVRVAVLDTGFRPHADLAANILGGFDFVSDTFIANDGDGRDGDASDPGDFTAAGACAAGEPAFNSSWHGTHTAGTIGAVTNNGLGVAGVAFGAKVVPVRVLGRCGGTVADISDAIVWASGGNVTGVPPNPNPARIISLSLGGGGACGTTFQTAINTARGNGTALVIAAGNENTDASSSSPANCNGVIVVAAVNRSGGRAFYSNTGTIVDLAAPGGDTRSSSANGVLSTLNAGATTPAGDAYAFFQGTSMATPHVAGVAALMLSVNNSLSPDQLESMLKSSTRTFPQTCSGCGTGIVNALAAVNAARGVTPPPPTTVTPLRQTNLSGGRGSQTRFSMSVPAGARNLQFKITGGTGDADLYVRFNSPPSTSTFNCRPFLDGNEETCTFATPSAGTWHVMIRGFAAYSGVTLTGSYTPAP